MGRAPSNRFSAVPFRGVAATAAKKTIKADKDEIEAEAKSVRDRITKGTYKFAPAELAFDIKNGTLRLAPATLMSAGAETKINGLSRAGEPQARQRMGRQPDRTASRMCRL